MRHDRTFTGDLTNHTSPWYVPRDLTCVRWSPVPEDKASRVVVGEADHSDKIPPTAELRQDSAEGFCLTVSKKVLVRSVKTLDMPIF